MLRREAHRRHARQQTKAYIVNDERFWPVTYDPSPEQVKYHAQHHALRVGPWREEAGDSIRAESCGLFNSTKQILTFKRQVATAIRMSVSTTVPPLPLPVDPPKWVPANSWKHFVAGA